MNTRIYRLLAGYLCVVAFVAGIAFSQTSNGDPPDNDIGGNDSPTGVTGDFNGTVNTAGAYDPYTGNAQRTICDIAVPGTVGAYPLKWTRMYNSRDPDVLNGMSVGWRNSYQWTMSLNSGDAVGTPDGRWLDFNEPNSGISERSGGPGRVLLGDGGQLVFEPVGYTVNNQQVTRFRLVQIVDPQGLSTLLNYETTRHDENGNAFYRLTRITEPAGRYLQLAYVGPSETDQIASVQAFDAQNGPMQSVSYTYATFTPSGGSGETYSVLTRVDYSDGTAAHYTYQNDNSARRGSPGIPLLKTCDDVRYGGAMRQIEYLFLASRIRGQIKSEKKFATGEAVSTLTFPTTRNAAQTRIETRGDSPTRTFTYSSGGRLISYTDFKNANPTSLSYDGSNFLGAVKDAGNHETTYTRETNIGQLKRLTHPGGVDYVELDYSDPNNPYYLTSRRDERNHYTFYDREPNYHRIVRIRYPDGAYEEFNYNHFGQVLTRLRRNGKYDHFSYDWQGRLEKAWNPTSNPANPPAGVPYTAFHYYPTGHPWAERVSVVYDPRNNPTSYEYDYNSAGQPCAGRGLVTKITHVDQTYLSFGYDAAGNLLWEENELRRRTTINYDDYSRPISVVPPAPAGPIALTYEPSFGPPNPYLHTAHAVHFQTDGVAVTAENKYDKDFRVTSIAQLDGTASPPTTRFEYWPVGTLRLVRDPRNQNWATSYTYDGRGQLETVTDALNRTTRFHHDPSGNVDWIDRPDGRRQHHSYEQMNRLLTTVEPLTDAANKTTTFSYWPSGRTKTVRDDNGETTRFDYDERDLQQFMWYPDGTSYQQWGYDEAGNLVGHRTVGGKIQRFQPDARNRITDMWWDPGNVPDWAHFDYDAANRLTGASNQNGTIARQYDDAGRLLSEEQNVYGFGAKTITYGSDGAGKPSAMGIAGTDYQFAYQYDALGRFEQILNVQNTPNATTKSLWYQYSYDAASNETQRYCPMNGVAQIYQRDDVGRIQRLTLQKATEPQYRTVGGDVLDPVMPPLLPLPGLLAGLTNLAPKAGATIPAVGDVLASEQYIYDAMDRAANINRQNGQNDGYGYDYSGQLRSASYSGPNPRSVGYSIDAVGNRSQVNDNGNVQGYSPMPNYRNQYATAPAGPVGNGVEHEIANYGGLTYTYLGDRQLASISGGGHNYQLSHDAFGRCVKRTLNGETIYYTYDGHQPIYEWKADGTQAGWNVYGQGIDEILLRADYQVLSGGQGYFFQQNRLGSVTHLTGFSGEVIESYRYDAFGAPTTTYTGGSFNNRFKFTGREYQANFGIYEYRARAYHPGLGRFLSEDPIGFAAGDSNLFRYCGGDPVNWTDPFGLDDNKGRIKKQRDGNDTGLPQGWAGVTPDGRYYKPDINNFVPDATGTTDRIVVMLPIEPGTSWAPGDRGPNDHGSSGPSRDGGSGASRGTPTGGGNPYFDNGHFLTDMGKGFERYNLPAHAAFWEEYAQWVPTFIPGMGGIGRVGSGLRAAAGKGLGSNPFKGKTAQEIADMLTRKGYVGRGPNPVGGQGSFVNPRNGRGYHINANHPPGKPPHVGVHRPRHLRDEMAPREYEL